MGASSDEVHLPFSMRSHLLWGAFVGALAGAVAGGLDLASTILWLAPGPDRLRLVLTLPLLGAVCLFLMVLRGSIRLPPLWFLWVSFLIWAGASSVMVDSPGRLVGFAQRLGALLGASLLVVYLYNARERLPRRRALYR